MGKYILTVALNPAVDRCVVIKDLASFEEDSRLGEWSCVSVQGRWHPRDACLKIPGPNAEMISAGGKGINVARTLKVFGMQTRVTGFLGGETGEMIQRLLRKEAIPSRFVFGKGRTRINLTMMDAKTRRVERRLEEGEAVTGAEIHLFLKEYARLLKNSSMVVLSGRNARGVPDSFYAKLIRLARSQDVPAVLDTSGRSFRMGLRAGPWAIKPNIDELREALGEELKSVAQIKRVVQRLHRLGVKIVLISKGAEGAIGSNEEEIWCARSAPVSDGHGVGCGDAFLAGFLYSFLKKDPLSAALRWAAAAGAANAMSLIPGNIRHCRVHALFSRVKLNCW